MIKGFRKILATILMVTTLVAVSGVTVLNHVCSSTPQKHVTSVTKSECACSMMGSSEVMDCCASDNQKSVQEPDCCKMDDISNSVLIDQIHNMPQGTASIQSEKCCIEYAVHNSVNESFVASTFSKLIAKINFTSYFSSVIEKTDIYCKVKSEYKKFENMIALPRRAIIKFIQYISHIDNKDDSGSNA